MDSNKTKKEGNFVGSHKPQIVWTFQFYEPPEPTSTPCQHHGDGSGPGWSTFGALLKHQSRTNHWAGLWFVASSNRKGPDWLFANHKAAWTITNFDSQHGLCMSWYIIEKAVVHFKQKVNPWFIWLCETRSWLIHKYWIHCFPSFPTDIWLG